MIDEPNWLSLLPPLLAISLAVAFRQVIVALLAGVWLGAMILAGGDPLAATLRTVDVHVLNSMADSDHASIILFTLMLGGMVGVVAKSGGSHGLADKVTKFATNSRRGQLSSWFMGLLIFFDDYANTLLVGSTMRPITDRLRISREKLAFIVDATAAPVASLALISSWIGVEIGYIAEQYRDLNIPGDAYWVFIQTIPYRFYPVLMLFMGLLIAASRRDFGPMKKAEQRALLEGKPMADGARPAASFEDPAIEPKEGMPRRWINALVPIAVVIITIAVGMYIDGRGKVLEARESLPLQNFIDQANSHQTLLSASFLEKLVDAVQPLSLQNIFGKANSYQALLWASFLGGIMAILMALVQRILTLGEAVGAWMTGVKSMILAMVILVLAWSLGSVCKELHTADFLIGSIGDWLNPAVLPALVFLISAGVSFATGTSWGTMAILFPLVIPLAHGMAPGNEPVMLGTISSILAGAVFGDHCSPISDTTIMSSMASSCDHIDHVRTQLPYALSVGAVGLLLGDLACGFDVWPAWLGLILGAGVLSGMVFFLGKSPQDPGVCG